MRAVLLCPGPSLAAFDDDFEGLAIGVNRAAAARACDVWAVADPGLFNAERPNVRGLPALLTTSLTANQMADAPWPRPVRLIDSAWMRCFCPVRGWELFTATAALVYAAMLGAHRVDVYGADWSGTNDWDAPAASLGGGNRTPERWRLEREIWENLLVPWLADRRVEVVRHSAAGGRS